MNKLALQITALSIALAGTASAADMRMPVKAPAPVAVAAYSWTGCYVGAGGGYGMWNQRTQDYAGVPILIPAGGAHDNGGRGWFGTVQVGCDFQVAPSILIGAFADYDFGSIKGDATTLFGGVVPLVGSEKLKNAWAAGGRIGWVPWSTTQFMVFVSGGYTQASFDAINLTLQAAPGAVFATLPKNTYDGWFIGTGYEYGLSMLPGLFWKTEYRFADYGAERFNYSIGGVIQQAAAVDSHKYVHTVRSELVWRFNFGGARY
jgi:outer membrane immunogenic protein